MINRLTGAVDIGGTKIAVGLVDRHGRVLASRECPTRPQEGFDGAMARTIDMLAACLKETGAALSGIGIGCTGPVYPFKEEIGQVDFLPGWEGKNPVKALREAFSTPVALENDADAWALGECHWGAGQGHGSVIAVTVGTGIGGGIILNGHIFRGVDDAHPEIGHHVIDPNGPRCFCGASGCWEVLASGTALAAWMMEKSPQAGPITAKEVCELALQKDPVAMEAVQREARYLGLGIANLVTLFAPQRIVLGGSVMRSAQLFMSGIRECVQRSCGLVPAHRTMLELASLGHDAGLIGAAAVHHYRHGRTGSPSM